MAWIPAICGGAPAFPDGPPLWRPDEEAVAVRLREAVERGDWNRYRGPNLAAFTERFAMLVAADFVLPCSSGTVGVEIALRGAGVVAGDEVVLGGYDFPGNFRAIEAIGALPVLVDLDPATRCLDVDQALAACGPQTKAIIATHLHGGMVDMPRLCQASKERNVAVVEDACQAVGGAIAGRPVGAWGDVGVYSFGGSKLLTAGRGGAATTNRADVFQRMTIVCERGNHAYPLSELQAVALLPQLEHVARRNAQRLAAVQRILNELKGLRGLTVPQFHAGNDPAFYKLGFLYEAGTMGDYDRTVFAAAARAEGIALDPGFRGFTRRSGARCRRLGDLAVATSCAEQTLVLHHPILLESNEALDRLSKTLAELAVAFAARKINFAQPQNDDSPINERDF